MKRVWILAALVLALAVLSPGDEGDVGGLLPVELLYVYIEEDQVWVQTDTAQWGTGSDLPSALTDLRAVSPGEVFLETADYLVLTQETLPLLPQWMEVLRPAARVCLGGPIDENAAAYLAAHEPTVTLADIRAGERDLETLIYAEGRYHIESR